ncbi:MAG: DUF421 domain-containing protein [Candidatus Onthoplasma sp.]
MDSILYLILLSTTSVVALFIIAKLLGKKQVAQLDFIDYVIGISIGSIAAEMATDVNDKPLYYYLIAMAIYFLFDLSITLLGRKSPGLKHFLKGRPLTIIYNGEIDYKILKKSKLDINDVLTLARAQGYFDLQDIAYAVFENNGELSIMPKGNQRPTVAKDLGIKVDRAELPLYLVIDGIISKSSLNEIKKDKEWLFSRLKISKRSELKKIILASYDKEKDKLTITYK